MYSFPNYEPVYCPCPVLTVASWPTFRFLRRQVRWSGIPISFRIFHSLFVIYTVKGFGIVNKTEVDVFLKLSSFFNDPSRCWQCDHFSKSSLYIWKLLVRVLLKPSLKDFDHYLASMRNECNCVVFGTFFGVAFLWDWNENWPFWVLWPLLSFPNLLAHWVQHLAAASFRVWNSLAGTPSPPLALFMVMLPKAKGYNHA